MQIHIDAAFRERRSYVAGILGEQMNLQPYGSGMLMHSHLCKPKHELCILPRRQQSLIVGKDWLFIRIVLFLLMLWQRRNLVPGISEIRDTVSIEHGNGLQHFVCKAFLFLNPQTLYF